MAHLRCQACNARVDESDVTCPVCNMHIIKSRKSGLIVLSVILICVLAAVIFWSLSKGSSNNIDENPSADVGVNQNDSKIKAAAFDAVLRLMKDPDSTKFGDDLRVSSVQGKSVVCGSVNSKNSFGGYSGFKRFLYFYESKQMEIEPQGEFDRLWHLFC